MKKILFCFLFASIIAIFTSNTVMATSSSPIHSGSVNGKAVKAQKGITTSSSTWSGWILSKTSGSGVTIGTIGWTYFNTQEWCRDQVYYQNYYGGDADYNDWYIKGTGTDNIRGTCSGHKLRVTGKHEYKDGGATKYIEFAWPENH
ncbi:MAG: hypothetical protein GYA34_17520 [Chloroflexi bacterium]|nr:hypothetical protein [Chloroflexota bacterium]